jgi:Fe2+ or Zn2+ uptake regulation protein
VPHDYTNLLRSRGFRLTPQRLAILQVLEESKKHLSAIQIYEIACQKIPGMTEATVYRSLNFLSEQGCVLVAHLGSGQLVYELAGRDHHHLICRRCKEMLEIDHADLEWLYQQFKLRTGFQIDSLHLTFFGLCPACLEQSN